MPEFLLGFSLVAVVLTVTALISGIVERSPLSFPLLFLGLGFALGGGGLGLLELGPHSEVLEIVATLTLALVLFLDAVKLDIRELGKRWAVPFLILGPGTLTIIAIGAAAFFVLFDFDLTMALLGGAVLASTDPVVLREIVRDDRIPRSVRQVLRVEAGTNDLVVLPILLVLIAIGVGEVGSGLEWVGFLGRLLILGPLIGFAIGGAGSWLMSKVDRRYGVRTEYQALFGVGLVFAAYSGATAAGGDGFLGAFAAGFAVVALNQVLCSCFLDYGETTAEMAMLVSFILFGAVLSELIGDADLLPALVLAGLVVFVIRPSTLTVVLLKARMSWPARW
ncbi:MAG: cation:proton antiporter, partial [Dehalococcoidia bacterium]